jgi:hypothetical protein
MSDTQSGAEVGRFGVEIGRSRLWRALLRLWKRPVRPSWQAPVVDVNLASVGRHHRHRGAGGFEVTRALPSGRTVTHYTHVPRDATLTTMVRPVAPEDSLERTQLVPFRPAGGDCL